MRRYKINRKFFLMVISVFVILALFGTLWVNHFLSPMDKNNTQDNIVTIPAGSSTYSVAKILYNKGLIKSQKAFVYYTKFNNMANSIKAGEYSLNPSMSMSEIVNKLVSGKVITISFTIPEGYDLKQIASVLKNKNLIDENNFWELVKEGEFDYDFIKGLPKNEKRLEGFLFPDTYSVPKGYTEKQIINMMLKRFQDVWNELSTDKTKMTIHEVVTLASIVEMEVQADAERSKVASVFLNRLRIGMALESCATIQYALPQRTDRVLYKDLEINSPYNTYKHPGLPPGPIASPGKDSLEAVLNPADTNYFYFVAKLDSSGTHVFSRTYAEHLQNKSKLGY